MGTQFLAADASFPSSSFRSCFSPTHPRLQSNFCACSSSYLRPGNSLNPFPSSSSSSRILHLQHAVFCNEEAGAFCTARASRVRFVGQEAHVFSVGYEDDNIFTQGRWCWGVDKSRASLQQREFKMVHAHHERMDAYALTENMCIGFGLHHLGAQRRCTLGYERCTPAFWSQCEDGFFCSSYESRMPLQRRNLNACRVFMPSFMTKGFFVTETDERQRQKDRQRALLSLCAQAMVASQMGQATLLSFLWTNWPRMVDEVYGGGEGDGNKVSGQGRDPDNVLNFRFRSWRVLLLGVACGVGIAMAIKSSASVGAVLDACFWLCLIGSVFVLAASAVRILCMLVMFISRVGIAAMPYSGAQTLQKWVRTSFCQGPFVGSKPRVPVENSSMSTLWRTVRTKTEGRRIGSTKNGRSWPVFSPQFGFLRSVLPKQTKI